MKNLVFNLKKQNFFSRNNTSNSLRLPKNLGKRKTNISKIKTKINICQKALFQPLKLTQLSLVTIKKKKKKLKYLNKTLHNLSQVTY